jgi:osmoprotectant transport system permease protein
VLRNTIVGLEGVEPAAVEAARGMGMTGLQILLRVQIPLASPVIMAGLRTSLVLVVGTATLGTFVGGGGLGDIISEGIGASPSIGPRIVLAGAAMAAGLALLSDWLMSIVARAVVPRT